VLRLPCAFCRHAHDASLGRCFMQWKLLMWELKRVGSRDHDRRTTSQRTFFACTLSHAYCCPLCMLICLARFVVFIAWPFFSLHGFGGRLSCFVGFRRAFAWTPVPGRRTAGSGDFPPELQGHASPRRIVHGRCDKLGVWDFHHPPEEDPKGRHLERRSASSDSKVTSE